MENMVGVGEGQHDATIVKKLIVDVRNKNLQVPISDSNMGNLDCLKL
jgi:hypothetical protein